MNSHWIVYNNEPVIIILFTQVSNNSTIVCVHALQVMQTCSDPVFHH